MLKKINKNWEIFNNLKQTKTDYIKLNINEIILGGLILKDMLYYTKIWRQIRGYSSNGQRSHSNNKSNKKQKILFFFRLQQFYKMFGKKRRDIFPSLVLAEYNNKLWLIMWQYEWVEARKFLFSLVKQNPYSVKFDPQLLAKNIITGVKKERKKKKHNVAKRKVLSVVTIGLPFFFSLRLYNFKSKFFFPFNLVIPNDSRRKMGKKKSKKKKKK